MQRKSVLCINHVFCALLKGLELAIEKSCFFFKNNLFRWASTVPSSILMLPEEFRSNYSLTFLLYLHVFIRSYVLKPSNLQCWNAYE